MKRRTGKAAAHVRSLGKVSFYVFFRSLASFDSNGGFKSSAALAFYGLFALIPLFLLVLFISGHYIISSQAALRGIERITNHLLPGFSVVIFKEVTSLSGSTGIWGTISMVILFWTVYPLVSTIRDCFFTIFKRATRNAYLKEKLLDILAVIFILLLFIFLIISEIVYSRIISILLDRLPFIFSFVNHAAPFAITSLFLAVFYYVFTPVRTRSAPLCLASVATGILWNMMRPAFSLFLTYNPQYGFAFGSLKAIFIVLLWVYYSFVVILFGAEMLANLESGIPRKKPPEKPG